MGIRKSFENHVVKKFQPVSLIFITSLLVFSIITPAVVGAATLEQQIQQLNQTNNQTRAANSALEGDEQNLQAVIARIQGEISAVETQITANQNEHNATVQKITEAEAELVKQKAVLAKNIRTMYVEGDISTVEMLASSKDLSHYMDKQQYRIGVQNKVKESYDTITKLKEELTGQKATLEKLIADQQGMQAQLSTQRAEQDRLLGLNQQQQAQYDQEIQNNNAQIADLRRQQIAANARFSGSGSINVPDSSGYPWADVGFPNSSADPWGMYKRQCVSYTAWKVWKSGRHMPYWGGRGNANQWDDNARAAGIPVDNNPRVGDVAVSNTGYYGHVMYVEAVHGDGTITISQYNAKWDGRYSEARISIGSLVFIHF